MDEFIDIIQEGLEGKRQYHQPDEFSFSQKLKRLQPELRPVAKELQRLIEAKATLDTGAPFRYLIYQNSESENYMIGLDLYPHACLLSYDKKRKREPGYELLDADDLMETCGEMRTDSLSYFIKFLGFYLGERLGGLGLLDKQIYSKKTQDHLGI
jgi:hypothetical protein